MYTQEGWQSFLAKLNDLDTFQADARTLRRILLSGAFTVEPDRQGRVPVPVHLREFGGLSLDRGNLDVGVLVNWSLTFQNEISAVTSASGNYVFTNLPAGDHAVRQVNQSGWQPTLPEGGVYDVSLAAGTTATGKDFGNMYDITPPTADIVDVTPDPRTSVVSSIAINFDERVTAAELQKAAANRPDAVAMINFGLDAVSGAREIFNFGLTPKVPLIMTWSSGVEELVQLTPEIRENIWVGSNFYYTADTPVAKKFVAAYQKKFGNPPGYAPSAAYGMTRMMLHAFDKAKSVEVRDVITALEGIEVQDLVGRMRVDPKTHQTLRPYFFMRCKPKSAMKHATDFADIIATGDTPLPAEYAACKDLGSF